MRKLACVVVPFVVVLGCSSKTIVRKSSSATPPTCAAQAAGAWTLSDTRTSADDGTACARLPNAVAPASIDGSGRSWDESFSDGSPAAQATIEIVETEPACMFVAKMTIAQGSATVTLTRTLSYDETKDELTGLSVYELASGDGTTCQAFFRSTGTRDE